MAYDTYEEGLIDAVGAQVLLSNLSGAALIALGTVQGDASGPVAMGGHWQITGSDGAGVILAEGSAGDYCVITNIEATNTLKVYPASGQTINGLAANASVTLAPNTTRRFEFYDDGKCGTPTVRQGAFTQTYATAARTHSAATAATLTVADGAGTNNGTIDAITDNASTIAAVQELAAQINKLVADQLVIKQLLNAVIDDLQVNGISG